MPIVVADAAFIHMVLRNLIDNAVKYSRTRDVAVIEVGAEQRSGEVVARDNGVGFDMPASWRIPAPASEEFEGTGIGWPACGASSSATMDAWAEGQLDKGATFYFALPKLTSHIVPPDRDI